MATGPDSLEPCIVQALLLLPNRDYILLVFGPKLDHLIILGPSTFSTVIGQGLPYFRSDFWPKMKSPDFVPIKKPTKWLLWLFFNNSRLVISKNQNLVIIKFTTTHYTIPTKLSSLLLSTQSHQLSTHTKNKGSKQPNQTWEMRTKRAGTVLG